MKRCPISKDALKRMHEAKTQLAEFAAKHQLSIGIAEMALGAGLIAWSVNNGVIELGTDFVATKLGLETASTGAMSGAAAGIGLGATIGKSIGGIGIAAMGGAIGIPALVVAGGAATIFGLAGFKVGEAVTNYFNQFDYTALAGTGAALVIGIGLLIDGGRRVVTDPKVLEGLSRVKDGVLELKETIVPVVAATQEEFNAYLKELSTLPETPEEAAMATGSMAAGAAIAGTAGASIAAGSATAFGSKLLGGIALSVGIISAPVWPVVLASVIGIFLAYALFKLIKYINRKATSSDI